MIGGACPLDLDAGREQSFGSAIRLIDSSEGASAQNRCSGLGGRPKLTALAAHFVDRGNEALTHRHAGNRHL